MAGKSERVKTECEKPEDITRLSERVEMFNKRNISNDPASLVFEGRRQFFGDNYDEVAIKLLPNTPQNARQMDILATLRHNNIVEIQEVGIHHGTGEWIYIVMPKCSMTLDEYIAKVDPKKAFSFFKQLVAAVGCLHSKNVAHRNLKPRNILISSCGDFVKVSDFAISRETSQGSAEAPAMDGFKAPELLAGDSEILLSSDIFSLGLIGAFLFSGGKHPFGSKPYEQVNKIMTSRTPNLSGIIPLSATSRRQQLLHLLEEMLQMAPIDRPTAQGVQDDLFFSL